VSEALEPEPSTGDTEEVDALVVLSDEEHVVVPGVPVRSMVPAAQAAVVAAGGFVAGAAVAGIVRRHRVSRRGGLGRGRGRGGGRLSARRPKEISRGAELLQIVSSRSLLVDVHLLGGRD
jgi:hypothetical protein